NAFGAPVREFPDAGDIAPRCGPRFLAREIPVVDRTGRAAEALLAEEHGRDERHNRNRRDRGDDEPAAGADLNVGPYVRSHESRIPNPESWIHGRESPPLGGRPLPATSVLPSGSLT